MLDQKVILDNNQEYKTNHKTTKRKIKFAKYENTLFFGNPDEGSTTTNNKLHASVSDRTGQISQSLRLPMYTNGFSCCGPISYHSNKTYAYFYFRSCDLKFHSFLYSRKQNINPLFLIWSYSTEVCVYSLKICTLLNTVKHSQIFRAEFHNSQGKSISVSSNTIYQSY